MVVKIKKIKQKDLILAIVCIIGVLVLSLIFFNQTHLFSLVIGGRWIPSYSYNIRILSTDSVHYKDSMKIEKWHYREVEAIPVALVVDGKIVQDYTPPSYCSTDYCKKSRPNLVEQEWKEHLVNLEPGTHKIQIMTLRDWTAYKTSPSPNEWREGQWTSLARNLESAHENYDEQACLQQLNSMSSRDRSIYSCNRPSLRHFCLQGNSNGLCLNHVLVEFNTLKEWTVIVPKTAPRPIPTTPTNQIPIINGITSFLAGLYNSLMNWVYALTRWW